MSRGLKRLGSMYLQHLLAIIGDIATVCDDHTGFVLFVYK
jgi:hypothetical protein